MPTGTGRQSAAERKAADADAVAEQEAAELAERENIGAKELATTGVVMRLRPQMITGKIEEGEAVHPETGDLVTIPLMVLDLHIPGCMINIEFPVSGAPRLSAELQKLCEAYAKGQEVESALAPASPADVKAAAAHAKATAQLRGDSNG